MNTIVNTFRKALKKRVLKLHFMTAEKAAK